MKDIYGDPYADLYHRSAPRNLGWFALALIVGVILVVCSFYINKGLTVWMVSDEIKSCECGKGGGE